MGVLRIVTDAVEKGICKNLKATLIQDWKTIRNLDSKSHLPGFACFKFQLHIFCEDFFDSIGQNLNNSSEQLFSARLR